ncbi:MAG TPA: aminotransferase class III-fold pyridoxal phosphate-dependent enzyme, partial [Alicyclobacillus sp.]|nr:aminotransferase class III-fold pyridoxal phosphate-dependent enzyme [Alicyclobacillus sp.]
NHPHLREIRGMGLMLGVVLDEGASQVAEACLKRGLLVTVAGGTTIRLLPPLIVEEPEIDMAVERLTAALDDVFGRE